VPPPHPGSAQRPLSSIGEDLHEPTFGQEAEGPYLRPPADDEDDAFGGDPTRGLGPPEDEYHMYGEELVREGQLRGGDTHEVDVGGEDEEEEGGNGYQSPQPSPVTVQGAVRPCPLSRLPALIARVSVARKP
jgi:hypothetical protein